MGNNNGHTQHSAGAPGSGTLADGDVSTKHKVLAALRDAGGTPVSGETISAKAGISRVSVWKAVQSLQKAGYTIHAADKGYLLARDISDSLFPWEFGTDERYFRHYTAISSTMDAARKAAEQKHETCIITADQQTQARGCGNHVWESAPDGLYVTLVTHPELSAAAAFRMTIAAQTALVTTLRAVSGRPFYVRWPNDIWTATGKVSGILDDVCSTGARLNWLNLGIGVNMTKPALKDTDCVQPAAPGTAHTPITRRQILSGFLAEFKKAEALALHDSAALATVWNSLCPDIGKLMPAAGSNRTVQFCGINGYGWARLKDPATDAGEHAVPPGEAALVKTAFSA